jgi:nitroreductase
MNETINLIKNRRSTRKYQEKQIPAQEIEAIMDAAIHAPNSRNQQEWHFAVVQDKAIIDGMVEIIKENILNSGIEFLINMAKNPAYHTFYHAPAVVLVTGNPEAKFVEIDCGAAMQTIALAAESLNISSCPITSSAFLFESEKGNAMKKQLGIPENHLFQCSIALGYREGDKPATPPRNKELISYIK